MSFLSVIFLETEGPMLCIFALISRLKYINSPVVIKFGDTPPAVLSFPKERFLFILVWRLKEWLLLTSIVQSTMQSRAFGEQ
jgi:hypothetical protein